MSSNFCQIYSKSKTISMKYFSLQNRNQTSKINIWPKWGKLNRHIKCTTEKKENQINNLRKKCQNINEKKWSSISTKIANDNNI